MTIETSEFAMRRRTFVKEWLRRLEMPLLIVELKDLAWRPRTYVVRFVYAAVLFTVACSLFFGNLTSGAADSLGRGRLIFLQFLEIQFWIIVLFLPAMTSGVITVEKERNALGVLMLTTLGPLRIILQKLLSRLIPMCSFLLLAMPLLAVAYSFGGVTESLLWGGIVMLFMTCVQIGVLSVLCSTWARTTPEALVLTYVSFFVLHVMFRPFWLTGRLAFAGAQHSFAGDAVATLFINMMLCGFAILLSASMLKHRAFLPPKNVLLMVFKELDEFFTSLNQLTGGVELVKDRNTWPKFKPVQWRETSRKSLGTFRYLFRVLVVLEIPILFACQSTRIGMIRDGDWVRTLLYFLWTISLLLVCVHGASLISSERSKQTLDVLLTTPISSRGILLQKVSGLHRLFGVLLVPFVSIYAFETWWSREFGMFYLGASMLSVLTLIPAAAWVSIWIGLRVRSQTRAILNAVGLVAAIALIPVAVRQLLTAQYGVRFEGPMSWLLALSPIDVVRSIETQRPAMYGLPVSAEQVYAAHFIFFGAVAIVFRTWSLHRVDHKLGRMPE